MTDRTLIDLLRKIILQETVWLRHYIGKVLDLAADSSGMIHVSIPELGVETPEAAFWCFPRDKLSLITPAVGDWVEIYFIAGDRNRPVYLGGANEIKGMLPKNYDGKSTTQVIFEDNKNQIHIKFDESSNILEIGNSDLQFAARITDAVKVTIPAGTYATITAGGNPLIVAVPFDITGTITAGSDQTKIGKV